jgi:hypothetical protein
MTWHAVLQCLNCRHSWREPAPEDVWEMACKVAAPASCPLCGARMRDGLVELLQHRSVKIALMRAVSHSFESFRD